MYKLVSSPIPPLRSVIYKEYAKGAGEQSRSGVFVSHIDIIHKIGNATEKITLKI